ncbi:GNAT family N-acetyltransferase [Streptomyces sp. NBC_01478]|uniref:GNAT family N-acetyltransferase n=1 Tax=Streptomyces sp. NBC_01478 TaxID=2903882 RepID=UPI002E3614C9|nr:GNAT family N-acetyltransferase [Streptomyces sp. NBC_01478]
METPILRAQDMDVVAGRWSLLAESLYSLPNWLRTAESREGDRHYSVLDGEPAPRGGLVVYHMTEKSWFYNNPVAQLVHPDPALRPFLTPEEQRRLSDHAVRLEKAAARLSPALVSVLPSGYLPGLLRAPGADDGVIGELADELEHLCTGQGLETAAVMHVPERDTVLRGALEGRGYVPYVSVGDCVLPVSWPDFDGYLDGLRSPRPTRIRREIRGFEESGAILRETTVDDLDDRHAHLHAEHLRRYGHDVHVKGSRALISAIQRNPTGRGRVLEAWRGDVLVGFVVCYEANREFHPKMIGVGPEERKAFTYFNLCYYGLIRIAARENAHRVVYGPESYEAKAFRGCAPERRISYLRVPEDLRDDVAATAAVIDAAGRRRLDSFAWQT